MRQILHGCARTTEAVCREIQHSKENVTLSKRLGLNHKTVAKWRHRNFVHNVPIGPKDPYSTVLMREEEEICVAFRKHSLVTFGRLFLRYERANSASFKSIAKSQFMIRSRRIFNHTEQNTYQFAHD